MFLVIPARRKSATRKLAALAVAAAITLSASSAWAGEFPVRPRMDVYAKQGNDRRLTGAELFAPLTWNGTYLTYADLRFVAGDDGGREGNAGLGVRRVSGGGSYILGGYGFFDRRRSGTTGKYYNQLAGGAEILWDDWDLRVNGYAPITGARTLWEVTVPTSVFLAGNRIEVTGGTLSAKETPLFGADAEIGYRPWFVKGTRFEETRIYAGAYRFAASGMEEMAGARARIETAPLKWLRFSVEGQSDNMRGPTWNAEARLRVPLDFWRKEAWKREEPQGILKRLDARVARDVDVVTQGHVNRPAQEPIVNAATGANQKVYVVENTAPAGGDGTAERPFNTLAAAENAAGDHDIIYVKAGDGTSAGMNAGITLAHQGQKLIGSGVALTYDASTMRLPAPFADALPDGAPAAPAGTAPIITNASGDGVTSGDGITMAASDTEVAGITVSGAVRNGIYAVADGATSVTSLDSLKIRDSVVASSVLNGIRVLAQNAGSISAPEIANVTTRNNTQYGMILVSISEGSTLSDAKVWNSESYGNASHGMLLYAVNGGTVSTPEIANVTTRNNAHYGMLLYSNGAGSTLADVKVRDSASYSNAWHGLYVLANSGGSVSAPEITNVTSRNNAQHGMYLYSNGAGSSIANAKVHDSESYGNTYDGLHVYGFSGGSISSPEIENVTTRNNARYGMYLLSDGTNSSLSNAKIRDSESYSNTYDGLLVRALGSGGVFAPEITSMTTRNNNRLGMYLLSGGTGSILADAKIYNSDSYNNAQSGLYVTAQSAGTLSSPEIDNLSTHNNTQYGMYFYSTGASSSLTGANVHYSSASANGYSGLYFQGASSGALEAKLATTTSTGNTQNGVYVDDDTTSAFTVDLGGGTLSSAGYNRIYGNTGTDMRVDLDGGQLKAQSNWWGNASGLLPARTTLEGGSTVDSASFLATDPTP